MDLFNIVHDLAMFIGIVNIIPERAVPPGQQTPGPGFNDIITEGGFQMINEDIANPLDLIVE